MRILVLVLLLVSVAEGYAEGKGAGRGGRGGRRRPPREAIQACENKAVDEACSFTLPVKMVEGSCFRRNEDRPPVCRPSMGPR